MQTANFLYLYVGNLPLYHASFEPLRIFEMTIQPARHDCHVRCLLRAEFMAFQRVADNTRGTRVEQEILRGSQLTWYVH